MTLVKRLAAVLLTFLLLMTASCGVSAEAELLVLMYHHINETGDDIVTVSSETFAQQLDLLLEEGWETVSPAELVDFVDRGKPLPEKPVCIVFDDGYESNYIYAAPALAERNITASICVIGWCMGKSVYKDTDVPIIPHLSWAQARILDASGVITIGSHTYDMHQNADLEEGEARVDATPLPYDTPSDFDTAFRADFNALRAEMEAELGHGPLIFAYPHGRYYVRAENILRHEGVRITFITDVGRNTIRRGDPDSLHLLRRYSINEFTDLSSILNPPETSAGTEGAN
ncbi:MAG: polysaccharide deacetylase family protein [Clostridia bacterium]|nr:polysaccharide deacetylase family protein [Clostridia bacterium]